MRDYTPKEAGQELARLAKMTASFSQNWENFAEICESVIEQVYEAGRQSVSPEARDE